MRQTSPDVRATYHLNSIMDDSKSMQSSPYYKLYGTLRGMDYIYIWNSNNFWWTSLLRSHHCYEF